jgi:glucosamine 6-phosphate synthetase-like amidotransferase/phosphosugar isomerase protein
MQGGFHPQALWEVEDAKATQQGLTTYECPCMQCHNGIIQNRVTIKNHMRKHGHDAYFKWPMVVRKI